MKIIYILKLLRKIQRLRICYPYTNHTPLTYRTRDFPPLDRLSGDHSEPVKQPVKFPFRLQRVALR